MYLKRIEKVRKNLTIFNADGMLVADGDNLKYLTGFLGGTGDGLLLIGTAEQKAALITDARYEEELRTSLPDGIDLLITRDYYGVAMLAAKRFKINNLGFEDTLPFKIFDVLDENFEGQDENSDIVPIPELVEWLRQVKSEDELVALRHSTQVAIQAYEKLLDQIEVGMTERQVANRLDQIIKDLGATSASFETIVASGYRGALPHGEATDKPLATGELVTIDFGYFVDGYTSDITRTFGIGTIDDGVKRAYQVVQEANQAAIHQIKAGTLAGDVDQAARNVIEAAEYGKYYTHATGHGVGLAIHEGPVLSTQAEERLEAGMLLTIEPGIYIPGAFGIRIEDDIIVTPSGVENLTEQLTTDLVIIDR
ncbi:aminopeptidase P family protein [Weissella coleopterorum]|uniref:Aminopeptidase P family protein n=1 Tax=Weissella coleopterorum TaxID=2714949 RepID=A0A6G8B1S3_9LACO|nr:aminopeptidase P family protein [Weissella coleopterorum]QIL51083.1 aminopeptidase P family protein [Weissella coleopterorum]